MGMVRTLGAVSGTHGTPTPVYHGTIIAAVTFSILNGIATIVLGAGNLPANGYNGPNAAIQGYPANAANGQQVQLWGFTTATYFNGLIVTVLRTDPVAGSFSFYFNHGNVTSTADTGNTSAIPPQRYRVVRLECAQNLGTDLIYVGDGYVSTSRYMAALSIAGQFAVEIAGDNIPAERIFFDCTTNGDTVQVSLIY